MQIDFSAAERFLSYVDGDLPLTEVWDHPAYAIARKHANFLGRDLTRADVSEAMANEQTTFSRVEDLRENRESITELMEHIRANEVNWTERIERHLERITPDEDVSDIPLFLAIGYEFGIGLRSGVYVNLNEPLFLETPRQLLYVAIHESSHVLYDRVHGFSTELSGQNIESQESQITFFNTLFHTEAYATYTPLELRKSDGNVGDREHVVCEDYCVLSDKTRIQHHVEEYDSFRNTLRRGSVSRETLLTRAFGGLRLPYRVGGALLEGIEEQLGLDEVRNVFYLDPDEFIEEYDWILDEYRTPSRGE